jgi:hypothetical protein
MRSRSMWLGASLFVFAACGGSGSSPTDGGGGDDTGGGGPDAGGGGDSGLADGGEGGGVNPHPTISSWVGTNVDGDLPRVDITYQLQPFDTPAAQKDANGYPVAGASGTSSTDIGFVLTTGMYKISYKGTGTLTVSGIGQLVGSWTSANGEQQAAVQITASPGQFGHFLTLAIANGAGQTVTDVHVYYPGFDYDSPTLFLPQFIQILAPFRAMRFMGWEATNGSTLANWTDRPSAAVYGASKFGEPYEHIAELVNVTGKDAWVNVPEHATDAFVHSFAQFLAQKLDFTRIQAARDAAGFTTPFQIMVENSNETWNMGFTAYATFLAAANAMPSRYTGTYAGTYGPSWMSQSSDLMKVGQFEGDRLVQIGNIFRQEFGAVGKADAVAPVLSGWALGAVYSDVALRFIQANYGDPKTLVRYVAMAPYFGPDDAQTGALGTLFTSAQTNITSMDPVFQDFAKLTKAYGLEMAAYEGGQGISGATNLPIKHLAQHDIRMYQAYGAYFAQWQKDFGKALFMHFTLAYSGSPPENIYQYGFWGSIISVLEDPTKCSPNLPMLIGTEDVTTVVHHCPKYRALMEQVP